MTEFETAKALEIVYLDDISGALSDPNLEQEVKTLRHQGRSVTKFLKTVSEWEMNGKCDMDQFCTILGWYFEDEKDPDWRKREGVISPEQEVAIIFPEINNEGFTPEDEESEEFDGGSAYGDYYEENTDRY